MATLTTDFEGFMSNIGSFSCLFCKMLRFLLNKRLYHSEKERARCFFATSILDNEDIVLII